MNYPGALANLIDQLSKLPSVGPKTAERYAFYLLRQDQDKLESFSLAIKELKEKIIICQKCNSFAEMSPCKICQDLSRDKDLLCLVENTQDLVTIESTNQYHGQYFVLGGLINTIRGIGPENLAIRKFLKRLETGEIKEIIVALNFTLEGETTALYLKHLLKDKVKISRLAKGLPAGSDLEYADELTLSSALKNRSELK